MKVKVSRHIDKTLVDAVNVDIILAHIFPVDLIDLRRDTDVLCHAWRCSDIFDPCVMRCFIIPDLLLGFKKARSSRNADRLECRRHSKHDGLICPAVICDQKIRFERIHSPGDTLYRGIIGLKIDTDISPVHTASLLRSNLHCLQSFP